MLLDGALHVLARQRVKHKAEDAIFELIRTVAVFVAYFRALQKRFDVTDGMCRHLKFLHQAANNVFLKRALERDVENADMLVIRIQALDASDVLLDDHRIPRQIVVHQHIGHLKVHTFGSGFR